ncbi:hypothetical protein KCU98_g112, partial [Aureobasidium melanogenum]
LFFEFLCDAVNLSGLEIAGNLFLDNTELIDLNEAPFFGFFEIAAFTTSLLVLSLVAFNERLESMDGSTSEASNSRTRTSSSSLSSPASGT